MACLALSPKQRIVQIDPYEISSNKDNNDCLTHHQFGFAIHSSDSFYLTDNDRQLVFQLSPDRSRCPGKSCVKEGENGLFRHYVSP